MSCPFKRRSLYTMSIIWSKFYKVAKHHFKFVNKSVATCTTTRNTGVCSCIKNLVYNIIITQCIYLCITGSKPFSATIFSFNEKAAYKRFPLSSTIIYPKKHIGYVCLYLIKFALATSKHYSPTLIHVVVLHTTNLYI